MFSASTIVIRPTRRQIDVFNEGSRIGTIKKHGILFPLPIQERYRVCIDGDRKHKNPDFVKKHRTRFEVIGDFDEWIGIKFDPGSKKLTEYFDWVYSFAYRDPIRHALRMRKGYQ